jgi:hypothetical protein
MTECFRRERVSGMTAIEHMGRRRVLNSRQVLAGRRLAGAYSFGVVGAHSGSGDGRMSYAEARAQAARDYERARDALGPRLWPTVWAIVCGDMSIQAWAVERRINATAAITTLRLGLDVLADHYVLPEVD